MASPDFSTLCCLDVQEAYRSSSDGLHLLVDSTDIKFLDEGEWKYKKAWAGTSASMAQAAYRHSCTNIAGKGYLRYF